jgi:hypothetical protein
MSDLVFSFAFDVEAFLFHSKNHALLRFSILGLSSLHSHCEWRAQGFASSLGGSSSTRVCLILY